ncbi:MAG: tellurium resistance protein TerC, partial [Verrucomicrobiales bacterium]|nr:tellurium resistance protein TerC [Verrucomicrobiales bacterium]
IGLAVFLRIGLLFLLVALVGKLTTPLFSFESKNFAGSFNFHSLIVLLGGAFIIYTAIKEIFHMTHIEEHNVVLQEMKGNKSAGSVITLIVLMNLVFSFDSILSAMALAQYKMPGEAGGEPTTHYVLWVMIIAIVISGILMIWLADKVSDFLQKNRMYEVLGLFILFVVGIMLVTEGGHLAHLKLFGSEIMPMTKTTFYFVIFVLVLTDIVQGRYQKKLLAKKDATAAAARKTDPSA